MILSRRRAHEASCPRSGDGGISSQKITIGWPQLQAVYPHHWAKSQWGGGVQRQTRVCRKQRVQCLKGLPLKINEKYTEISHLWSGKFAWKAQGAIFCLTESNWSNSLRRKGGWSLGKEKKMPHDRIYTRGDHLWCSYGTVPFGSDWVFAFCMEILAFSAK